MIAHGLQSNIDYSTITVRSPFEGIASRSAQFKRSVRVKAAVAILAVAHNILEGRLLGPMYNFSSRAGQSNAGSVIIGNPVVDIAVRISSAESVFGVESRHI
jgi:hypothetical protein